MFSEESRVFKLLFIHSLKLHRRKVLIGMMTTSFLLMKE